MVLTIFAAVYALVGLLSGWFFRQDTPGKVIHLFLWPLIFVVGAVFVVLDSLDSDDFRR